MTFSPNPFRGSIGHHQGGAYAKACHVAAGRVSRIYDRFVGDALTSRGLWRHPTADDLVDVLVYVVVLNLATQYVPSIITETFSISLLTALLLKVVLEVVIVIKDWLKGRFRTATSPLGKVAAGLGLWATLVLSKFVVLELEELLLGDAVNLGGFISVTVLILVLMLSRAGVRRLLDRTTSP